MASNLLLIVLLVLVSLSLASGYSFSTRDAVSKQDDESYIMTTSDQDSSMVVLEDVVKGRRLLTRVVRSGAVVNKSSSKSYPSKSKKKDSKKKEKDKKIGSLAGAKKKLKSFKIGALTVGLGALIGIIIAAVVGFIVIVVVICLLLVCCLRHKAKKAKSTEQGTTAEKPNGTSGNQTAKADDHV
ncbi:unnamed protein product [Arabidopsis thaliana]|uniref:Transmembrane protein n=1 Tax=Arabidopsis thaliana TaxID=3702 RepID=A0A5S9T564_ARATH|nr:unnamed protein product [Arabidopsis thaliana]